MGVTITDNFTPKTWAQSQPKTWGNALYQTWMFGLHEYGLLADVTLAIAEQLLRSATHRIEEDDISVADQFTRETIWERSCQEAFSIMETYWDFIQFRVSVSESFTVTDDETHKIVKGVLVTLNIAESVPKTIEKPFSATIFVEDDFFRKVKTLRKFAESLDFVELVGKQLSLPLEETFEIVEFFHNLFTENVDETFSVAEVIDRSFSARRVLAENIDFEELLGKHSEVQLEDFLSIRDTILRASNAILNNIFVKDGEMSTLEDFNKLVNKAPGFTEFIDFKVGEYDYEEALVKVAVRSKMEGNQPTINNLTIHVDIPDTDARGTLVINNTEADLSGPKRVMFSSCENSPFYYSPPEVNALVIGGYSNSNGALTPYITSITTEYFEVEIRNASGSRVSGTISWFAKGY